MLGLGCRMAFSLAAASGGCSLVVIRGLLAVASLLAERGLQGAQTSAVSAPGLSSTGSLVVGLVAL